MDEDKKRIDDFLDSLERIDKPEKKAEPKKAEIIKKAEPKKADIKKKAEPQKAEKPKKIPKPDRKKTIIAAAAVLLALLAVFCFVFLKKDRNPGKEQLAADDPSGQSADTNPKTVNDSHERVVVHGCGMIDGYTRTNSREALLQAIAKGYRDFEMDLLFTCDCKLVLSHSWEDICYASFTFDQAYPLSYEAFSSLVLFEKYHPLSFDEVAALMKENPHIRIITDAKDDVGNILNSIAADHPDLKSRIIVQIYSFSEYETVKALGFDNIILTLYKMKDVKDDLILSYVDARKDLYAVALDEELWDTQLCRALIEKGVSVYIHTINSAALAKEIIASGCIGIYSDYLTKEELGQDSYSLAAADGTSIEDAKVRDVFFTVKKNTPSSENESIQLMIGEKALKIKAKDGNEEIKFRPGEEICLNEEDIPMGISEITLLAFDGEASKKAGSFFVRRAEDSLRIVSSEYKYRLDEIKPLIDMNSALSGASSTAVKLLKKSFIAKAGDYRYFADGSCEAFTASEDVLNVRAAKDRLMLPLRKAANAVGISQISMDKNKVFHLTKDGTEYTISAATNILCKGKEQTYLDQPAIIYNGSGYIPSSALGIISERTVLDNGIVTVIVPKGTELTDSLSQELLSLAGGLYE